MYRLRTESTFDSAHFLFGHKGKCRNIHGHTWRAVAEVCAEELRTDSSDRGMVVDFADLKADLKALCDELDHGLIFETGTLKKKTLEALAEEDFKLVEVPFRPTSENMAAYFYKRLEEKEYSVSRIEIYETPTNGASYGD